MHVERRMPAIALAALLALAGVMGVVKAVEADVNVRHRLDVETGGGKVLVRVMIENHGQHPIWVPREIAAADFLSGPRFDLRSGEGALAYIGRMVKRAAPGPDDYLEVKPNTTQLNTIDITAAYAFKPGQHAYEIRYAGPFVENLRRLDVAAIQNTPSAPVRFTHTGQPGK